MLPKQFTSKQFTSSSSQLTCYAGVIFLVKDNNGNTSTMCEIYSKLTIMTLDWHKLYHVLCLHDYIALVFLLLTLNRFYTLFQCFHCWIWPSRCQLGIPYIIQRKLFTSILWRSCSEKPHKISHRKTPVAQSFSNKVANLQPISYQNFAASEAVTGGIL